MGVFIIGCGLQSQDHLPDAGYWFRSANGLAFCLAGMGMLFFGLKYYGQRQGYLSLEPERATQAHFAEHFARNADEVCAYILAEHGHSYSSAGAAKLMRRLGFVYKKPRTLPAQADETKQAAFIAKYEALMMGAGSG